MNELKHYGVLGMRWGVRNYQNKDGTRTKRGLFREKVERLRESVALKKEAQRLTKALNKSAKKQAWASRRFHDNMSTYAHYSQVAKKAKEKGLDKKATKYQTKADKHLINARKQVELIYKKYKPEQEDLMVKAVSNYKNHVYVGNKPMLVMTPLDYATGNPVRVWGANYKVKVNKDMRHGHELNRDELKHYGVLGMRWGVRNYQNKDGTRTAKGRRHEKKLKDAIVKAYKTGKKIGGKAIDAHISRKKARAALTRAGVLKNKKLFTTQELRDLENRFKVEDELKNASRNQRIRIAQEIATYGNTVKSVGEGTQKAFATYNKYQDFINSFKESQKDIRRQQSIERYVKTLTKKAPGSRKDKDKYVKEQLKAIRKMTANKKKSS